MYKIVFWRKTAEHAIVTSEKVRKKNGREEVKWGDRWIKAEVLKESGK